MIGSPPAAVELEDVPDWTGPLTPTGNLRRRALISRVLGLAFTASAVIAIAMLVIIVAGIVIHGASVLSPSFLFTNPQGIAGGGILAPLLGTLLVVALAGAIALPIGVLTGLYLTEFVGTGSRTGRALKLALDLMQGLPTIVTALFIYGLIVIPSGGKHSGFALSVAYVIVALPLIARSSQEVLELVPSSLREAADALGVNRWRTVVSVIVPTALGGIMTGAILALARAAGETAPALIVNSVGFDANSTQLNPFGHGVPTIVIYILEQFDNPAGDATARAFGASVVLFAIILLANAGSRILLARSRRRMGL